METDVKTESASDEPTVLSINELGESPPLLPSEAWSAFLFFLSLIWLLAVGGALHIFESNSGVLESRRDILLFTGCAATTAVLWLVFLYDVAQRLASGARNKAATILCTLLPALRLGLRDPQTASHLWLPRMGWQRVDQTLNSRVETALRGPMLIVSLAVLPLLTGEYLAADYLEKQPGLKQAAVVATAIIWWAFTFEFILMISITDKKLKYVKEHWLDLVIILLPLIAFLRVLRLSRIARLQQLTKTSRVFRFRGVAMKTYRALLLIDAVSRLIQGSPEKRLVKLRQRLADQEAELATLRNEIAALETQLTPAVESLAVRSA
ncbi:MAG: hypothetical protein Q8K78_04790 [Planctomycetaceae bacterium]|nr:hypothetical protein [Planctomycetaceae bacterium]